MTPRDRSRPLFEPPEIRMQGTARRLPRCRCGNLYDRLCDAPVKGRHCDAPLCGMCSVRVGENDDRCGTHAKKASA